MFVANSFDNEIEETLKQVQSLVVFENGKQTKFEKGEERFNKIMENISSAFAFSRIMPAFGVSLHELTVEGMKTDSWIKLNFGSTQTLNDLPFNALLFRLDECYGLNLIRETEGKFQGRCIYLDLNEKTDLQKIID